MNNKAIIEYLRQAEGELAEVVYEISKLDDITLSFLMMLAVTKKDKDDQDSQILMEHPRLVEFLEFHNLLVNPKRNTPRRIRSIYKTLKSKGENADDFFSKGVSSSGRIQPVWNIKRKGFMLFFMSLNNKEELSNIPMKVKLINAVEVLSNCVLQLSDVNREYMFKQLFEYCSKRELWVADTQEVFFLAENTYIEECFDTVDYDMT